MTLEMKKMKSKMGRKGRRGGLEAKDDNEKEHEDK